MSGKSKAKIHVCSISVSVRVRVVSYVRIRLLFLSSCGVYFGGHFMTFIVFLVISGIEVELKCEGTLCDAY